MRLPSLLFLAAASVLPAATHTVTSTADSGAGSLRSAIAAAVAGDEITFGGAAFTGPENTVTIRLTSAPLVITKAIAINGIANANGGNKVIVTGDADASGTATPGDFIAIAFGSTIPATLTLHRLTFMQCSGSNGGAVTVDATPGLGLAVSRCRFVGNRSTGAGGAVYAPSAAACSFVNCHFESNSAETGGAVELSGSTAASFTTSDFIGNQTAGSGNSVGGGLAARNIASLSLTGCRFSGNQAPASGGAVYLSGTSCSMEACLFDGNSAGSGGGIYLLNIAVETLPVTLAHCTFSGNQATVSGSAVALNRGTNTTLRHCTVTANTTNSSPGDVAGSVALSNATAAVFDSCLIAGNTDSQPVGGLTPDVTLDGLQGATASSAGGNVIGDATGSGTTFTGPNDLDGTAASPIPADVLPLADNGGPTLTHALQPLAEAVDFAASSTATEDQRGEPRPSGGARDAGAFERQLLSFADWAAARLSAFPVSERQANDDPDGDGLSNGIEFIQGTAPAVASQSLDRVEIDAGGTWYSFTVSNEADLGTLTAEIEQSGDLSTWQASALDGKNLGAIFDSTNATRTRYRLPVSTAGRPKFFFRLNVRPLQVNN
jgi:Right handed beta helix region